MWALDAGGRGFAPITWRDDLGLAGMLFADRAAGERHLARLKGARPRIGAKQRAPVRLLELAGDDLRAREEWLRAVLDAGAARVAFDLDPATATPAVFELTGELLAEVLGHKRGLACLKTKRFDAGASPPVGCSASGRRSWGRASARWRSGRMSGGSIDGGGRRRRSVRQTCNLKVAL